MTEERLLNVREVSLLLGISEKDVLGLVENNQLPAYKVGGVYLRFKRQQVEDFKISFRPIASKIASHPRVSLREKLSDFFYFYDFYLLSILIILLILIVIFHY